MSTLLSIAEVARILGVSESFARRLARQKKLQAEKIGHQSWVTTRDAVKAYERRQKKNRAKSAN